MCPTSQLKLFNSFVNTVYKVGAGADLKVRLHNLLHKILNM